MSGNDPKPIDVYAEPPDVSVETFDSVCNRIRNKGFLCLFLHPFMVIKWVSDEFGFKMFECAGDKHFLNKSPRDSEKWNAKLQTHTAEANALFDLLTKYISSTQSVLNTLLSTQGFVSVYASKNYDSLLEFIDNATLDTYTKRVKTEIRKLYKDFKTLTASLNVSQPVWEEKR